MECIMMIRFWKCMVPLLISVTVVLSGCAAAENNISLLQSPLLANKQHEELREVLTKLLPADVEYLTPKEAQQKQSIFIDDINQDGRQEGFVLYRETGENQQVNILVLQKEDGKWNKVQNEATAYRTLDYFKLEDLDGDGYKEVVVGVGVAKLAPEKQLLIFEWDNKGLTKKVERNYEALDIADYNEDGIADILLLEGERNISQTAQLFCYVNGQLQSLSSVELDPSAYHENIVSGRLLDGKKALFIDNGLGAHSMLTEIVAYDNGKLIKIGDVHDRFLFKAYPVYSKDINNDGVTEAVGMYIPNDWGDAAFVEMEFFHVYDNYSIDGTRKTVEERYTNGMKNFYIIIPPELYGSVTVEKLDEGVRLLSSTDKSVIFEVKWIDKESFDNSKIKLNETKETVFYTDIKGNTIIPRENFHLFEDDF